MSSTTSSSSSSSSRDFFVRAQKLWLFISLTLLFRRWYCGLSAISGQGFFITVSSATQYCYFGAKLPSNLLTIYSWSKLCRRRPGDLGKLKPEILIFGIYILK